MKHRTRLLVCTALLASGGSIASAGEWIQRLDEDGIIVHTRSVPGSSFEAFRGQAVVPGGLDAILATLLDGDRYQEWFPNCPRSALLERSGNVQLQYAVTSAPWPVDDRDAVYEYTVSRDPAAGSAHVVIGTRPEAYPRQKSVVRMEAIDGHWSLRALEGGRTEVVLEMHLEPGGNLPAWLANARAVETPKGALAGLIAQFEAR